MRKYFDILKGKFKRTDWKAKYEEEVKRAEKYEFKYNRLAREIKEIANGL